MSNDKFGGRELWFTVGPSSLGKEKELLINGATGARLTFSYGTTDIQVERAIDLKQMSAQAGLHCCIIADLAGEKFRLGKFIGCSSIQVSAGTPIRLIQAEATRPQYQDLTFPVPNPSFISQVRTGSVVTMGDGAAVFRVSQIKKEEIIGELVSDGVIESHRGLFVQGSEFHPRSLTDKDLRDLQHILSSTIYDIVALSFVGSDSDVRIVRQLAKEANSNIRILAKIETISGIENLASICRSADLVMAARGDLALSLPWVDLPSHMERIASEANANSTPWILATQIVEGIDHFAFPTRAEICDLAHWLERGCAGVMLSRETAFGSDPTRAVNCTGLLMARWTRN